MRRRTVIPCCLVWLLAISGAAGDTPPRVLCLTDSVQAILIREVAKDLKGSIQVVTPQNPVEDSGSALASINALLGTGPWDVIYFNYGLGDLVYKDPNSQEIRTMSKYAGAVRVSSPEQYERNLEQLVERLEATGAKLIWGTTTPLIDETSKQGNYRNFPESLFDGGSAAAYNQIAAHIVQRHSIAVVDLHGFVCEQFSPEERHPPFKKYADTLTKQKVATHGPLVEAIRAVLKER